MSATTQSPLTKDIMRDIFLWRNRKLSLSVLLATTATWVLLEVYQFNFITVFSWVAMSIVAFMFLWGNMHRLLGKEAPSMSGLEISEQTAREIAYTIKGWIEEGERWMFRVSVEREWYVFAGVVVGMWILSLVGSMFDLLTLLYIGIVLGMTVPVIYEKYEEKLKGYVERMREQGRRWYAMADAKILRKMKNNNKALYRKEKKVE
ncbi:hypothetical protein HHK36_010029 [Tetracentron sinense]|uniref:Reticulon-like protein n=1 Tax=Tetracentron sinense TaxID=13715 RepID=A0A834ZE89_TETSI|nr:hypothetical protein HHK36_010029 [Tetracentron sinense]